MRRVRLTWAIGGAGLSLCAVLGMLQYATWGWRPYFAVALEIVFAASVLLFAIGLSRQASVVARRPLGVIALFVVALWPLVIRLVEMLLPRMDNAAFTAGLDAYRESESLLTTVFYTSAIVSFAAAVIAAVQIARAGTVPGIWRWAPMWAVIATVLAGVLPQLIYVSAGPVAAQSFAEAAIIVGALGFLAHTLGLGVIALMLASRVGNGSVEIFRSN